jgi:hypothetical protein
MANASPYGHRASECHKYNHSLSLSDEFVSEDVFIKLPWTLKCDVRYLEFIEPLYEGLQCVTVDENPLALPRS